MSCAKKPRCSRIVSFSWLLVSKALTLSLSWSLQFFELPDLEAWIDDMQFPSKLVAGERRAALQGWLPNKSFELLYRATEHGFGANHFHERCNNRGATVTIVRDSVGNLFGGYTSVPWRSCNSYSNDPNAFLFSLVNPSNTGPVRVPRSGNGNGNDVYDHANNGPTFGGNHDLCIATNSNAGASSQVNIGFSYQVQPQGAHFFTGNKAFQVAEIEVLHVKDA